MANNQQYDDIIRQFFRAVEIGDSAMAASVTRLNVAPELPAGDVNETRAVFQAWNALHRAFPDLRVHVKDVRPEGEWLRADVSVEGTHQGEAYEVSPTGMALDVSGATFFRFDNDRLVQLESDLGDRDVWAAFGMSGDLGGKIGGGGGR
jgi:predicted ester cyclase